MKDGLARYQIDAEKGKLEDLTKYLGLQYLSTINTFCAVVPGKSIDARIEVLEREFAALKESAKPVCKTCGQKVQDGFKAGQIETLAADVKRKR